MDAELTALLTDAVRRFNAMTPAEQKAMIAAQRESWVRSIVEWPKPKFHWENGVKVYDSYEDYCND